MIIFMYDFFLLLGNFLVFVYYLVIWSLIEVILLKCLNIFIWLIKFKDILEKIFVENC